MTRTAATTLQIPMCSLLHQQYINAYLANPRPDRRLPRILKNLATAQVCTEQGGFILAANPQIKAT